MRQWEFEEKPACSVKNEPFPEEVKCTGCAVPGLRYGVMKKKHVATGVAWR
jgi:hypothetical protein